MAYPPVITHPAVSSEYLWDWLHEVGAGGITQLTGDVTAGPGYGSNVAVLSSTGVTPGSYSNADITVDAKGRLTAASTPAALARSLSLPTDPLGTTSTTGVMMGLAGGVTPARTGNVLIIVTGSLENTVANRGAVGRIRYGTGVAPANGDTLTGTLASQELGENHIFAGNMVPFSNVALITGATLNTPLWLDIGLRAIGGGTASAIKCAIIAFEL